MRNSPWTEQELQFIKDNYHQMTNKKIADHLDRSKTAVDLKINRMGLKKSKYSYNHHYFETINTQDKAYWLGFIFADGCVTHTKRSYQESYELSIKLQARDFEHLKKLNKAMNGNVEVTFTERLCNLDGKVHRASQIRFYSKKLVTSLISHGVIPRKSLVKQFPKVYDELMPHFIRGYFDGDGSIHLDKKRKHPSVNFTSGSESFLKSLRKVLFEKNVCSYMVHERENTFRLYVCGMKNCDNFLQFIYDDADLYLERKKLVKDDIYKTYNVAQRLLL